MKYTLLLLLFPYFLFSQTQIGQDIDGEASGDESGWSVSSSANGNIIAIGARSNDGTGFTDGFGFNSGQVRVYETINNIWTQIAQDIDGLSQDDNIGHSVSLSDTGNKLIVGSIRSGYNGDNSGQIIVYENINNVWTQVGQKINGESAGDLFGYSVDMSSNGNIIAVGSPFKDSNGSNSGSVRIFEYINTNWTQIGQDIDGESISDKSGHSISLSSDGNIIAIGAYENESTSTNNNAWFGHVRVYENINNVWTQVGQDIDGEDSNEQSGRSVSISANGNIVAIGAPENNENGNDSGKARVYENINNIWTQKGEDIVGENAGDKLGSNVSLSSNGNLLAIAAERNGDNGASSGQVRLFEYVNENWTQLGEDINGENSFDGFFGLNISLASNGNTIIIGAPGNDGNGSGSGHARVFDLSALLSSDEYVLSQFILYPNPANNQVNIQLQEGLELKQVNIYNTLGQFISTSKEKIINTSHLSVGMYLIEIETNQGKATKQLVIE